MSYPHRDDDIQDACIKYHLAITRGCTPSRALFSRILHDLYCDASRRASRRPKLRFVAPCLLPCQPSSRDDPIEILMQREAYQLANAAINLLPPLDRLLFVRHCDGVSNVQLAQELRMTPAAVAQRLCRIRRALQARINRLSGMN